MENTYELHRYIDELERENEALYKEIKRLKRLLSEEEL